MNFATTTWGKQWIHSILKIGRPYRMQRGIDYAKDDRRIENLSINKGQIFATVQGTAPSPYRVKINFEIIPNETWNILIKTLAKKPINLINLLEGILPEEITVIFEENKYSLFPDASNGLNAECSCPDKAVPCKHIASLILYLSRVIDYDPFILLKLRGKTKEELLNDLNLAQSLDYFEIDKTRNIETKLSQNIEFTFNLPKISIPEVKQDLSNSDLMIELNKFGFKFKKPGKYIETLENLGNPPNLENPKAFNMVLKAIYNIITKEIYKKVANIE